MYRHEHNVCRNTDVKGHSGEVFEGNEQVIRNWRKVIVVKKFQRTWLNCILVFCER